MKKNISLYEGIKIQSNKTPDNQALYYKGLTIKYKKLLESVNKLASGLDSLGVKKEDVVTICLPNFPFSVYLMYALNQNGNIINFAHPLLTLKQMTEIICETKSNYLFCLDSKYGEYLPLKKNGLTIIPVCPVSELSPLIKLAYKFKSRKKTKDNRSAKIAGQDLLKFLPKEEFVHMDKEDQIYLHSGGTTSKSKTIALSSYALNSLAENTKYILELDDVSNKYMYSLLPMFHGFGLCMGIHSCLFTGGVDNLMPKFNVNETVKYIKANKLNFLIGIPPIYEALLSHKDFHGDMLKNLYVAYVGADFVSKDLLKRFNTRMEEANSKCRLFEGYGLTETVTVITVNTFKYNREGSVGRSLPCCKLQIRDLENTKSLPSNVAGEVYCSGDTLMNGYRFSDNDAFYLDDKKVLWVKTGDMGYLDSDGYLFFKQRLKRIIKVSGITVFPTEIEYHLTDLPFIFKAVAKGVPDLKRGSMVKLFVILTKDKSLIPNNYEEIIRKTIKDNNGVYAEPREIVYMESFPETVVGKVDTNKLN